MAFLIGAGADVDAQDDLGRTALMVAACCNQAGAVRLLLDAGAGKEVQDRDGITALGYAAHVGHEGVTAQLLEAGAEVEARDRKGRTALMLASEWGASSMVTPGTALMFASTGKAGKVAVVAELLRWGADPDAAAGNGSTALSIARSFRLNDVESLLDGSSALLLTLHIAPLEGGAATVSFTSMEGGEVAAVFGDLRKPLSLCAAALRHELSGQQVRLVLPNGRVLDSQDHATTLQELVVHLDTSPREEDML